MSEQIVQTSPDVLRQAIIDEEHLKLLSIGYLVSASMNAFGSLFGVMYAIMGIFFQSIILAQPPEPGQPAPPEFLGWLFGIFGLGFFVVMATLAVLKFVVWHRLKARRSRTFCMVVAAVSALGVPYGTMLCIFTLLVLSRPSVSRLFQASEG